MKVVLFAEFKAGAYSGGRAHAWLMAEGLATFCESVVVVTREVPAFWDECCEFPAHNRIAVICDAALRYHPNHDADVVVCVPSLSSDWTVYARAIDAADQMGARLVLLDFEAPSWFNARNVAKRKPHQVLSWKLIGARCDAILSSTGYGAEQARAYYTWGNPAKAFLHCAPSINSLAADRATGEPRRRVICIARMTETTRHKGVEQLKRFLCDRLTGYELLIIGRTEPAILEELRAVAAHHAITIVNHHGLSEVDKYRAIRESALMLFLSDFEGYGYPPLEAAYCGVPSILRPLAVFREVQRDAPFYWAEDQSPEAVLDQAFDQTERAARAAALAHVGECAAFPAYVKRLRKVMDVIIEKPAMSGRGGAGALLLRFVGLAATLARTSRARRWGMK